MNSRVIEVSKSWARDLGIGIAASVLLGLAAPLAIHLPFTPVPVVIQAQLAMVLAAMLGPRRGVVMILAFLMQGIMGFPVFAGGASTIATILGPRGGYLAGYLVAAFAVGRLYPKLGLFFSMIIGNVLIYLCGFAWLTQFMGIQRAFALGIAPFIVADFVKISLVSAVPLLWKRKNG